MKFETYVYKIVLNHQPKFHKDPCKDAHARGVNARTRDEMRAKNIWLKQKIWVQKILGKK